MNEYVELADLKAFLGMASTDDTRNSLLNESREEASRRIDDWCGRRFYLDASVSARIYNPRRRQAYYSDGGTLLVDDIGAVAGLIVEEGSSIGAYTVITTQIECYPENALARGVAITSLLRPVGYIGGPYDRVRVTAKWGWPAIPSPVVSATRILAAQLFKRKDSTEGVLGSSEFGTIRISSRMDPDAAGMLGPYVVPGFG